MALLAYVYIHLGRTDPAFVTEIPRKQKPVREWSGAPLPLEGERV
jgi:hypothetical protein